MNVNGRQVDRETHHQRACILYGLRVHRRMHVHIRMHVRPVGPVRRTTATPLRSVRHCVPVEPCYGFARELGVACFGLLRHNSTTTWMQLPVPMRPNLSFYLLACLRARPYQTSFTHIEIPRNCLSIVRHLHSRICLFFFFSFVCFCPSSRCNFVPVMIARSRDFFFRDFFRRAYYDNDRSHNTVYNRDNRDV